MLRENAVVLDYANGIAKVKCQSQSACGQCAAKSGCGGNSLSELNGKRGEHIFSVASLMPLRAGQIVEIGLEEKSMLLSALLTYIVPLAALLFATLFSDRISDNEPLRALIIFIFTACSFVLVKRYDRKFAARTEFKPVLLRIFS